MEGYTYLNKQRFI